MEYRKRDALRKSRIFLLENVIFDELVDHVIDQDIFSDNMLEYIKVSLVSRYHIVVLNLITLLACAAFQSP